MFLWFMDSLHDFRIAIGAFPLTRPSGTLSPSEGGRDGVRGRFMDRHTL